MAKTQFTYGVPITPDFLNSISNHRHTGFDEDGSSEQITNAELSKADGQIYSDFYKHLNELKVTQVSALLVRVNSGYVLLPSGQLRYLQESQLSLPDNSTLFIYIDQAALLKVAPQTELGSQLLARVRTTSGATVLLEDLRQRSVMQLPLSTSNQPRFIAPLDQLALFDSAENIQQAQAVSMRPDGRVERLNQSNWKKWVGIAQLPSPKGDKCRVALPGRVANAFTALTPGQDYYIQYTTQSLQPTGSLTSFYCGRALSKTELLLAQTQP